MHMRPALRAAPLGRTVRLPSRSSATAAARPPPAQARALPPPRVRDLALPVDLLRPAVVLGALQNPLQILRAEHDLMRRQLAFVHECHDAPRREVALRRLSHLLLRHGHAELELVYPIAKRLLGSLDSGGELVREMRADHRKLRRQLRQLGSISDQADKRWGAALAELSQDLQHHLRHEESHLFPLLARALQPSAARRLLLLAGMRLLGPLASLVRPFWPNVNGSRSPYDGLRGRLLAALANWGRRQVPAKPEPGPPFVPVSAPGRAAVSTPVPGQAPAPAAVATTNAAAPSEQSSASAEQDGADPFGISPSFAASDAPAAPGPQVGTQSAPVRPAKESHARERSI